MKVVLLENIRKLGRIGEIVSVKDGFGRNWLLPEKKALRATPSNLKVFEEQKSQFETRNTEKKIEAEKLASTVKDIVLEMVSPAQANGVLYGSITIKDIYDALKTKNVEIAKNQINLHKPIKEVGKHEINIALHPEVVCAITLFIGSTKENLNELINPGSKSSTAEIEDEAFTVAEEVLPTVESDEAIITEA